ncbi:Uncharacterized protein HZ326_9543 [Fusarium oxysporum f. sp. albedinis]|nr:Uncharacterized protein HZ326_9543 [Fusarium oxysporum f. sp. albedinis]
MPVIMSSDISSVVIPHGCSTRQRQCMQRYVDSAMPLALYSETWRRWEVVLVREACMLFASLWGRTRAKGNTPRLKISHSKRASLRLERA